MSLVTQTQQVRQPNPQPSRNQPQRPVRPVEREQEQLQYQPNRSPPTSWESQYQPEQSIPSQQKPAPIAKPPQRLPSISQPPAYTRRPETYYEDDEDEELVKYEMPVTRSDPRCPRDDDPAKPVHFPSGSSCVKFQKCFNGIAYEMSCPPGLQFDAKHSRCDYPARANCAL
uniref:Chitin-binding type-2 domain-containing protein n=1 Tax=Anopheles dirus TaxID=7168 RepID=A0A182MXF3_9DIPT